MKVADLLVPHDLSPLGDRTLARIARMGLAAERVHLAHVLPRFDRRHPAVLYSRDEDEPRRAHALATLRDRASIAPFPDAVPHVVIGDPAVRIVDLARELGVGLIAMSTHGRTGVQRMLLGSVAEHVVRFAPCPVLVLPAAVTEAEAAATPIEATAPSGDAPDQLEAIVDEVCARVAARDGFLTALYVGLPRGGDEAWWEEALTARLARAGVAFVDLGFSRIAGPTAEILDVRFEERFFPG